MTIKLITLSVLSALLLAGCATKKYGEEEFLTEREQKQALARTKSPQYFGFQAFPAAGGIGFRGSVRLHPNHRAEMDFIDHVPVIKFRGKMARDNGNALLDFSSPLTRMEYSTAEKFGATFMSMNEDYIPYRGEFDGDVNAYAAVIGQLRFDQLFMESVPLYVRMSRGALGPFARNIFKPDVHMAVGWDILSQFETIQISLRKEVVIFSSSHPYTPHEDLLLSKARIKYVSGYGLCVDGAIYGKKTPIVIDIAGDFYLTRSDKKVAQTKQVSIGDLVVRKVNTQHFPFQGALPRAGRRLLENYLITICPQQGVVYIERYPE
ncbi:hypothetical protein [Pontiella agarivorans]|uniref:Lipoprotein n=1 Tax=Pontiella agarivorans TaxID=3038953 RepID=A0ABU5MYZ3_9BACT|nr:hypothetical protein [Pontiella agarivorans]MDZ8119398.1 hypothetical protein [Pontiella agarivorans]